MKARRERLIKQKKTVNKRRDQIRKGRWNRGRVQEEKEVEEWKKYMDEDEKQGESADEEWKERG